MSGSSEPVPLSKPRLQEARRLGYTPRSPELTSGVLFLAAAWIGSSALPRLMQGMQSLVAQGFSLPSVANGPLVVGNLQAVGIESLRLLASCWVTALVLDLLQVGPLWNPTTPLPHEQRINPIAGLSRLLGWQTWERALGLSLKLWCGLMLLGCLVWWSLSAGRLQGTAIEWKAAVSWSCTLFASLGGLCMLFGLGDAWIRRQRWRTALELTEDERRHAR